MNLYGSLSRLLGRSPVTKNSRRKRRDTSRRLFGERLEERSLLACVDGFTCVDLLNKGQLSQGNIDVVGQLCYKLDGNILTMRTTVPGATGPNQADVKLGLDDDTDPWGDDEGILGNNSFIDISDNTLAPLAGNQEETEPIDPPGPVTEKWFYEVRISGPQLTPTVDDNGTPGDYTDDVTEYTVYVSDFRYISLHFNAMIGSDDVSILGFIDTSVEDDCEGSQEELTIEGFKYNDHNGNGVQDVGDEGIAGWHFTIWVDSNGNGLSDLEAFVDAGTLNGVYDLGETFTDTNGDGVWGLAEVHDVVTGPTGAFSYSEEVSSTILAGGIDYDVQEVLPSLAWVPTQGENGYSGTFTTTNTAVANLAFGNTNVGSENGKTIGFWSNKNGQALITTADLQALRDLNLRNANGTDFDPATAAQVKSFLVGSTSATATNMANMLSAQLIATVLNVRHGNYGSSTVIYIDGVLTSWTGNSQGSNLATNLDNDGDTDNADADGLVNQYGFASIAALISAANAELGLHSTAMSGDSWRAYQEALKIAFDGMNNNLAIFAQ